MLSCWPVLAAASRRVDPAPNVSDSTSPSPRVAALVVSPGREGRSASVSVAASVTAVVDFVFGGSWSCSRAVFRRGNAGWRGRAAHDIRHGLAVILAVGRNLPVAIRMALSRATSRIDSRIKSVLDGTVVHHARVTSFVRIPDRGNLCIVVTISS
jgi:hypothetical protein